jgi:DNA-binding response OmpR family regulator
VPAGPAPSARRGPEDAAGALRGKSPGGRVLVADDEPTIRLLCSVNLGLAGYDVVEAESGRAALDLIRSQPFDLVLLDVMLPDIGGHEVLRTVLAERSLPVAFFSARAARADVRTGLELGAVDYIVKPFDPVGLAQRVAEILERVARGETEAFRRARITELGE